MTRLRSVYEPRVQLAHLYMITRHGTAIAILAKYRRIRQEFYSNRQTCEGAECYIWTCSIPEAGRNLPASPAARTGGAIQFSITERGLSVSWQKVA